MLEGLNRSSIHLVVMVYDQESISEHFKKNYNFLVWYLLKGEVTCLLVKTKCDNLNHQDQWWRKNQQEVMQIVKADRIVETKADDPDSKTENSS